MRGTTSQVSVTLRATLPATLCAALVACGTTPKTHVGGPCQSDHTCDDGQACDQTDPGGPVCLEASGDLDGDGIPNDKDFCEHMAGGDHDEDLDGIGDECDRCPVARPPGQADSDGDAVDSPCDPDSRTPGDKIVLFNGFNTALPSIPNTWKIEGGEAIMTPADAVTVEQLTLPLAIPSNRIAILAAYRVDKLAPGANEVDAGVIGINDLPMGKTTVMCGGSRAGTTDSLLLQSDTANASMELVNLFNPASRYQVTEQLSGAKVNCALISDTEHGVIPGTSGGFAMTRVGLYARGATVRFQYLLVLGY